VGPCRWAVIISGAFYGCGVICVLLFAKENEFSPGFLGDPYGRPRQPCLVVFNFFSSLLLFFSILFPSVALFLQQFFGQSLLLNISY
jgi:hypothetical protein